MNYPHRLCVGKGFCYAALRHEPSVCLWHPEEQGMFLAYEYLRTGDRRSIPESRKAFQNSLSSRLSKDPLQQARFSFLYSATLALRYAVDGGLTEEQAYSIYRLYVRQMDGASSAEEIESMHAAMITDFTEQVSGMVKTGQIALPHRQQGGVQVQDERDRSRPERAGGTNKRLKIINSYSGLRGRQ